MAGTSPAMTKEKSVQADQPRCGVTCRLALPLIANCF